MTRTCFQVINLFISNVLLVDEIESKLVEAHCPLQCAEVHSIS